MKPARIALGVAALALVVLAASASADDRGRSRDHDRGRHPSAHWRGDIRHFHGYDLPYWRAGRWLHGPHLGRVAWWWVVAGVWYPYAAPVYPYPDPYVPSAVVVAPAPPAAAPAAPAQPLWYYCGNPAGYYPYVPACNVAWQPVPATPAPASAPPPRQ